MIMSDTEIYGQIIKIIIDEKIKAFGKMAIDKASSIEGVTMMEDGSVKVEGNGKEAVEELLIKFEDIAGKISTIAAAIHVKNILKEHPEIDIPDMLK